MSTNKRVSLKDEFPLTCSRSGTCCHGKNIAINPWELSNIAHVKGITPIAFREKYTVLGGIRLAFTGAKGWRNFQSCSLYDHENGCSVHSGRPLACRLFPLGLMRKGDQKDYIYRGEEFPCLDGCPEVTTLPTMTVADYLAGQNVETYESAQLGYLQVVEKIADGAFSLLLDSGLAETGDRSTLKQWRKLGNLPAHYLVKEIPKNWLDLITIPNITLEKLSYNQFITEHEKLIEFKAQKSFGNLTTIDQFVDASVLMMALALYLGWSLGISVSELSKQWIGTAKSHGALE